MNQYPRLRDKVEQLCHNYVAECERTSKAQVELMVLYETAFVNTVHPECVLASACSSALLLAQFSIDCWINHWRGSPWCTTLPCAVTIHTLTPMTTFARFSTGSGQQRPKSMSRGDSLQAALGQKPSQAPDTLIRAGQLTVLPDKKRMLGKKMVFGKEYFFKLTLTTLSYFKSEDEQNLKFAFKTEGCKLIIKDALTFTVLDPTGQKKLSKGESPDQVEIKCGNKEETQEWQAALLRAGVYPVKKSKTQSETEEDDGSSLDPLLERQVDSIRNLVDQCVTAQSPCQISDFGLSSACLVPLVCCVAVVFSRSMAFSRQPEPQVHHDHHEEDDGLGTKGIDAHGGHGARHFCQRGSLVGGLRRQSERSRLIA